MLYNYASHLYTPRSQSATVRSNSSMQLRRGWRLVSAAFLLVSGILKVAGLTLFVDSYAAYSKALLPYMGRGAIMPKILDGSVLPFVTVIGLMEIWWGGLCLFDGSEPRKRWKHGAIFALFKTLSVIGMLLVDDANTAAVTIAT